MRVFFRPENAVSVERSNESHTLSFDAHRFESLGANCEFGFFLQDHGNHETSLFKWAEVIGIDGLTRLLRNDFEAMFAYENVVPFNASMVFDRSYWIAWHSKMQAEAADPTKPLSRMNARFSTPEPERRKLWNDQNAKLQHFVGKLRQGLRTGERIFVYKPRLQDAVTEEEIVTLGRTLRSFGSNTLLVVTLAERPDDVGTVRRIEAGLLRGFIDRFAPGDRANDYSGEVWLRLCRAALEDVDRGAATEPAPSVTASIPGKAKSSAVAKALARLRRWTGLR